MKRRNFFKKAVYSGLGLVGTKHFASGSISRSNMGSGQTMIIDCHYHIGRGERMSDVFQIDSTPEHAEKLMNKAGIDRAVIFPVAYEDYSKPNREIAELAAANKRFIGFARLANNSQKAGEQLEYAVKELGLKGLKVGNVPTREIMDKARELKIPVLAHCGMGYAPIQYEGVAQSYPDVTLILAHLGFDQSWGNMFSYPQQANSLARKYKNVYLDTSAATWISYTLEHAVAEVGADKLIFGSDGPWFSPAIMLACLRELELPERDMQKILYENIAGILKL
jgi:predicted TIM-barrel fold metal-dependent hydrolase